MSENNEKKRLEEILDFFCDTNKINVFFFWIVKIWYILLLFILTKYVCCNFTEIAQFTFFNEFNGKNLIFIVWISLLLLPFFDSFEGFGVKFKRNQEIIKNQQIEAVTDDLKGKVDLSSNQPENLKAELENKLENATKKKGGI